MKIIKAEHVDTSVCVNYIVNDILIGSFFKDKPEKDDLLELRGYWLGLYRVLEVLDSRDAKVQPECTHNTANARMKLRIEKLANSINGINQIKIEMMDVLRN